MVLSAKDFRKIEVDGELMLLPTIAQVNVIAAGALIEAKPVIRNTDIIAWKELISGIEPPVFLGLHCGFPLRGGWWSIYLLQQDQLHIRVHLERIVCDSCGWSGRSANPVVGQLYDGSADPVDARLRGFALPIIKCQNCSCKLPRPSVWVEG